MKTSLLLLAAGAAVTASAWADDDIIPKAFSKDRYAAMAAQSPFVLATKVDTTPDAPKPSVFDNMYVKGVGTNFVVLQKHGDTDLLRFWGSEPYKASDEEHLDYDGMSVKEIKWSDTPGATTVIMKLGSEEKELIFNQNELKATSPAPAAQPGGARAPFGARPNGPAQFQNPLPNQPRTPTINVPRPTLQPTTTAPRANFQAPGGNNFGGNRGNFNRRGGTPNDPSGGRTRSRGTIPR